MKELITTHKRPRGKCSMCDKLKSLHFHHIIPKRYKTKTQKNTRLFFGKDGKLFFHELPIKIEHAMIAICDLCHKKLHAENYQYHLNEYLLKRKEKLEELE